MTGEIAAGQAPTRHSEVTAHAAGAMELADPATLLESLRCVAKADGMAVVSPGGWRREPVSVTQWSKGKTTAYSRWDSARDHGHASDWLDPVERVVGPCLFCIPAGCARVCASDDCALSRSDSICRKRTIACASVECN